MARILFSSIISDISGSIGSCTFQRNAYGNSLRLKPMPNRSSSPAQQNVRAKMSVITQAWRNLSFNVQNQFNNFASYSKDTSWNNSNSILSGYNLFVKWYFYLLQGGFNLPANINFVSLNRYVLEPSLRLTSGNLNLLPYPSGTADNCRVAVYASAPYKYATQGMYQKMRYLQSIDLSNSTINLDVAYIAAYGSLPNVNDQIDFSFIVFAIDTPIVFTEQLFHLQVNP